MDVAKKFRSARWRRMVTGCRRRMAGGASPAPTKEKATAKNQSKKTETKNRAQQAAPLRKKLQESKTQDYTGLVANPGPYFATAINFMGGR